MKEKDVECFLLLCRDVLLEVLHWGNRCQLIKLERVGKRFHWYIEHYFEKTQFLRLNLVIWPRFFVLMPFCCYFSFLFMFSQSGPELEAKLTVDPESDKKYSAYSVISLTELETFSSI